MKYLVYGFLFIVLYKILDNASMYIQTSRYRKKYEAYLKQNGRTFHQYVPAVTKLFKAAGIEECHFPIVEPVGYGYVQTANVSHFTNLASKRRDFVAATIECFDQAKAIFRSRIIETFSPLYWVRFIVFLPKNLFNYLGIKADSIIIRIAQVIYWMATPFLLFFRDNIYQYIISCFS